MLTTDLGALEAGRTAFIQDATGGIALYLEAAVVAALPVGTSIVGRGIIDDRFAQRTLRIAEADLVAGEMTGPPLAILSATGAIDESAEGLRLQVGGTVTSSPEALADGTAVTIDDGSGALRVIVTPAALGGRELSTGSSVTASGPLGQRDSSGPVSRAIGCT